ncbi:MAG TPA: glycosyltransferase family 4 protein [Chlorobiota bacterium]|nr:glycosyltransferase family 4 protein [Chlorobiota bacterium]
MRVLHVCRSAGWGGLEQYVGFLVRKLKEQGIDVSVMAIPGTRVYEDAIAAGVRVISARSNKHVDIADIRTLRRFCTRGTVVHTHERRDVWLASLACYGTRASHVYYAQMVPVRKRDPWHWLIYRRIDAVHNSSPSLASSLPTLWHVPAERVWTFGHMRDRSEFFRDEGARAAWRREWGVEDNDVVFGLIGRIDPQKGVREFVTALTLLSDDVRNKVRCIVAGEPSIERMNADGTPVYEQAGIDLVQWLQERVIEFPNQLVVLPFQRKPVELMSALDVFVMATYAEMYAFTVLESMMAGCAVIGTNSGGTPDQLGEDRGILVEPRSAEAIAAAMTTYVRNTELRKQHAEKAREWVLKNHTTENVLPKYIDLYQRLSTK